MEGLVKKWIGDRGFGFITPTAGGNDVFVHVSALIGVAELREGQRVSFEEEPDPRTGRLRAKAIRPCDDPPAPRGTSISSG